LRADETIPDDQGSVRINLITMSNLCSNAPVSKKNIYYPDSINKAIPGKGVEIKMADNFKVKAKKALNDARVAAHAVLDDVSVAAHNTLVDTEADVQKVSDEVKISVHKAVADVKIAAHEAGTKLKKK
jgi:hypothetical protein